MKKVLIYTIAFLLFNLFSRPAYAADYIRLGGRYTYPIGNDACNPKNYNDLVKNFEVVDPVTGKTIRTLFQEQLAEMRKNGLDFIKLVNPVPGVVDGKIPEPYRTNFIHAVQDIKNSGLGLITGGAAPDATVPNSDPKVLPFDPSTIQIKWALFQDAHSLVEQYGPSDTLYDLGGEVIPATFQNPDKITNMINYATKMWQYYVSAYGNQKSVMSAIADQFDDKGNRQFWGGRLETMIDVYKNSGKGYPSSWDFSLYAYPCQVVFDKDHPCTAPNNMRKATFYMLQYIDNTLNQHGLNQPIAFTETFYDDADVAAAISDFRATSNRKILFVSEWPLTVSDQLYRFSDGICQWPPYTVDNYAKLNIAGDFNKDGRVNYNDFNVIKSDFSTRPYTIYDYNKLVANFGK